MIGQVLTGSVLGVCLLVSATAGAQAVPTDSSAGSANSAAKPTSTADEDQVREWARQGALLYKQGRFEEARGFLLKAWEQQQSYDTASTLGLVELELDHPDEAAKYLSFSVRHFPPTAAEKQLTDVKNDLADAKKRVGSIYVRVDVAGASVLVDGKLQGRAPLDEPVFVMPGLHRVVARYEGREVSTSINASAGQAVSTSLTFPAESKPPASNSETSGINPKTFALIGGLTLTGGALLSFGYFTLRSSSATDDAAKLRAGASQSACITPSSECDQIREKVEQRNRLSNTANWSLGVAAVAGVGTAVVALVWPDNASTSAGARLLPIAAPGLTGLSMSGRF